MKTASWILRNKATKEVICETFDPRKVAALNKEKYEAVPILEYLQSLNTPHNQQSRGNHMKAFIKTIAQWLIVTSPFIWMCCGIVFDWRY